MSYILDALRRADAERERGSVPTVHAHPAAAGTAADEAGARRARPWLWAGGLALLLLALGAGLAQWLSRAGGGPAPVVITAAPTPPTPPPPPPPQQQQQQQAPPPVTALPDPVAAVREPPRPAAAVAVRKPPVAAAPRAEPPALVERPVPLISALPEDLRRQLPALTAGGAMYSEAPANRMLIINGQLLHEGDRVAPDLVLEQIKLRGAVLSFKGQRFRISY